MFHHSADIQIFNIYKSWLSISDLRYGLVQIVFTDVCYSVISFE